MKALIAVAAALLAASGPELLAGDWRYDTAVGVAAAAPERPGALPVGGSAPSALPANNVTMASVIEAFGEPSRRAPAVGEPPITRWYYPAFTVYFEHDRVITSVP